MTTVLGADYPKQAEDYWYEVNKCDTVCRELADRHYSRQKPGTPQFTRPGYNMVLRYDHEDGTHATFVWWRPKWESGIPGTCRKDKLRCIENTLFRNETPVLSSELIRAACYMVYTWEHAQDVSWPDGLITSINSKKTQRRRSKRSRPGECFYQAGFILIPDKHSAKADIWLRWEPK